MDDEDEVYVEGFEIGPHKASPWVVAAALAEFFQNAFEAVSTFFQAMTLMSMAHYTHIEQQSAFHAQAAVELETLTKES